MIAEPPNQESTSLVNPEINPSDENAVKLWIKRIKASRDYFKPDFDRMRDDMLFAAGIQWAGQDSMDPVDGKYIANFITKFVNDKVASLYARDPKVESKRRKRLDYTIWDGTNESLLAAQMALQQGAMMGMATPQSLQAMQLMQDFAQGQAWEKLCEKVGKTLEIVYQYECDTQSPNFKFQMKQLVRQVITTGCAFVRLNYVNSFDHILSSSLTDDSLAFRMKLAESIRQGIADGSIQDDDPRVEQLRLLMQSVQNSVQQGDTTNIEERLEFDFIDSTSVIVDNNCRCLKGFIGAQWVAQQFILPLNVANAYFELRGDDQVKIGGTFLQYTADAMEKTIPTQDAKPEDKEKEPLGCFWEVFDLKTKTSFFICDGWQKFVKMPQPVFPSTNRFWPIFSITFNDIVVEKGQKAHIYPPSDVQLLKPMQKERNRTREELRDHRRTNRPFFWALTGTVEEGDLEKLANHETGELIQLKSCPMGANGTQNVVDAIGKWTGIPIDQNLYTTAPLDEDVTLCAGTNQIQQQQPIRHVAATPAVLQEQARMSGVNSNVDDLDSLLSELAQAGGEMILRAFNPNTVTRIAGRGAAFPDQQREDFLNEVLLDIVASSSGRPNKAVEIANFERIAPILIQAIPNPNLWPVVEEALKRLDDRLDVEKFLPKFPMGPAAPQAGQGQQGQPGQQAPKPHQATGQSHVAAQPIPGVAQ